MVISTKRGRELLDMDDCTWVCLDCFMFSSLAKKIEKWTPPRSCPICEKDMYSKRMIAEMVKENKLEVFVSTGLFFSWPRFEPFALDP